MEAVPGRTPIDPPPGLTTTEQESGLVTFLSRVIRRGPGPPPSACHGQERTMPEDLDTEAEYEEQDPDENIPKGLRRKLAKEAKAREEAEARALAAERRNAFFEAKLPDTPQAKYFRDTYTGEASVEAVKEAALAHGFIEPPPPDTPAEELAAHDQIAGASAGASSPSGKLRIDSEEYRQRMAAAESQEEVLRIMAEAGSPITTTPQ